jgi:ornithine--oxo-acid transaminase
VGVEFKKEEYAQMFSKALLQNGIIAKTTQKNTIRFAPPLIISEEELEKAMKKIKRAWKKTK